MTPSHLPEPVQRGGLPAFARAGASPAVRADAGAGNRPPLHGPGALGFADRPHRDYWWQQLGEQVRNRIVARVGPIVEWWADSHGGGHRPSAVVLGERGLAVSTPTLNGQGRPAQRLTVLPFVPSSLRHATVTISPRPRSRRLRPPAVPEHDLVLGDTGALPLPARLRGFLGNLPAEAQSRLQWPFVNGDSFARGDYYYLGAQDEINLWCYLAGRRWVSFVSGHGAGLSGPRDGASWRLTCRRAEVATR